VFCTSALWFKFDVFSLACIVLISGILRATC